jgi:hypothetical protein
MPITMLPDLPRRWLRSVNHKQPVVTKDGLDRLRILPKSALVEAVRFVSLRIERFLGELFLSLDWTYQSAPSSNYGEATAPGAARMQTCDRVPRDFDIKTKRKSLRH